MSLDLSLSLQSVRLRRRNGSEAQPRLNACRAFSLIEIIAVLAIISILAAAILPVLIRQIDYASEGTEATNLVAMATGFTQAVSAQRQIPGQGWDNFIATNIGWQLTAVQNNAQNNARAFLIDTNLAVGATTTATLPYYQTSDGATNVANVRFIILSSLSGPLPVSSGVPAIADFNALWNTPNDTIPVGTSWSFNGQGADLKIQRINLTSAFNHLVLNAVDLASPFYSIDNFPATNVQSGVRFDAYFLAGTVLNLYSNPNAIAKPLQASQVLQQDTSLFFCNGLWRNAPCPLALSGLEAIVQGFYTNSPNPTTLMSPSTVYTNMLSYMSNYLQYAASGFNPANRPPLQAAAIGLNNDIQNLVK